MSERYLVRLHRQYFKSMNAMRSRNCQTTKERRRLLMNVLWHKKDLVKMLEVTGTKSSISTVKWVLYGNNLKGHSARKKTLLQNHQKRSGVQFATAHGDKDLTVWWNVLSSDETKFNQLTMMTIVKFGRKRGSLQAKWTMIPSILPTSWQMAQGQQSQTVGETMKIPDLILSLNLWKELTSVREQGGLQTWLSYISSVERNGLKFQQLIVRSSRKVTQNIWPKLTVKGKCCQVYVRIWVTGHGMK